MVGKSVKWTKTALLTFNETLDFFINRNGNDVYSNKLYQQVIKNELRLLKNPFLGISVENTIYRKLIFVNYSLFYKVVDSNIMIVLFWDNRRNPDLLEIEILKLL